MLVPCICGSDDEPFNVLAGAWGSRNPWGWDSSEEPVQLEVPRAPYISPATGPSMSPAMHRVTSRLDDPSGSATWLSLSHVATVWYPCSTSRGLGSRIPTVLVNLALELRLILIIGCPLLAAPLCHQIPLLSVFVKAGSCQGTLGSVFTVFLAWCGFCSAFSRCFPPPASHLLSLL